MNRLNKVRDLMKEKNLDAILITSMPNIFYFSNFKGTYGNLLILKDKTILFTDNRYKLIAEKTLKNSEIELVITTGILKDLKNFTKKNYKIGIEDMNLPISAYFNLKNSIDSEIVFLGSDLSKLRMPKEKDEIEKLTNAIKIAEKSLEQLLGKIKLDMSEKEIANKLEYLLMENGAEERSFETIVASGINSALPHARASSKKLEKGEFLKIDFGAYYEGYASDITRTFVLGKASNKHLEIYNAVKEANLLGIKSAKEGITFQELHKKVKEFLDSKGYGQYFTHSLGHGLGIEVHEYPYAAMDEILKENMIITIEPGIYIENFGGVRIEDDILITKEEPKVLTNFPKNLIELDI